MKTINLEEIFKKEYSFCPANPLTVTQTEFVLYAMREACNQTVDLCEEVSNEVRDNVYDPEIILNVKNQIK